MPGTPIIYLLPEKVQINIRLLRSCGELRCQLYIAKDQQYLHADSFQEMYNLATEISVSLNKLIKYLQESDYKGKKYK
jgi:four helix bundle protein